MDLYHIIILSCINLLLSYNEDNKGGVFDQRFQNVLELYAQMIAIESVSIALKIFKKKKAI